MYYKRLKDRESIIENLNNRKVVKIIYDMVYDDNRHTYKLVRSIEDVDDFFRCDNCNYSLRRNDRYYYVIVMVGDKTIDDYIKKEQNTKYGKDDERL